MYETYETPAKIAEYFGIKTNIRVHITAIYANGEWLRGFYGQPTLARLRGLSRRKTEAIAVTYRGRTADFTIAEIIKYSERPLFGGKII
jgi:hypothetical protein